MSDNNNKKCVPELRFPGFTGDWVEKKLGECFDTLTNSTLSRADLNYETGKALYVHYGDILIKFGEILNVEQEQLPYITDDIFAEKACRSVLRNGDIILADTAEDETAGKTTEVTNIGTIPVVAGLHTIPLRPLFQFANGYLGYYFNSTSYRSGLFRLMQGAKVTSISKTAIKETRILFPSTIAEQEKIAECLSSLDDEISAETEQVEALKEHKKGMMQQMFPSMSNEQFAMSNEQFAMSNEQLEISNGKCVPKLRFPGFEGEWVEKKLGECFDRITNKNTENNQNVLTISAQYGLISQLDFFKKSVASSDVTGYYLLHNGDFAYNKSTSQGKPYGAIKPLKCYDKGVVSTLYICFKCKNLLEISFWEQYFDAGMLDRGIMSIAQEGARNHGLLNISTNEFFDLSVFLPPTLAEQEKIAECLSSIDEQIAAQQQKVEALKEHKKGLMRKLFPMSNEQ